MNIKTQTIRDQGTDIKVNYGDVDKTMGNPFEILNNMLREIKMMLQIIIDIQIKPVEKKDLITLKEACELIHLSPSCVYKMSAAGTIPLIKREGSRKLLFSRCKLEEWMRISQVNNISNVNLVDEFIHKKLRVRKTQNN